MTVAIVSLCKLHKFTFHEVKLVILHSFKCHVFFQVLLNVVNEIIISS